MSMGRPIDTSRSNPKFGSSGTVGSSSIDIDSGLLNSKGRWRDSLEEEGVEFSGSVKKSLTFVKLSSVNKSESTPISVSPSVEV
jgi:hypothetical protein